MRVSAAQPAACNGFCPPCSRRCIHCGGCAIQRRQQRHADGAGHTPGRRQGECLLPLLLDPGLQTWVGKVLDGLPSCPCTATRETVGLRSGHPEPSCTRRRACFHSRLAHTAPACPSPSMPPPPWPVWRAQPAAPLTTAPLPGAPKERLAWHHAPRMMARTGCMVTRAARLLPKCAAQFAPPCLLTSLPAELFVYGFQFI